MRVVVAPIAIHLLPGEFDENFGPFGGGRTDVDGAVEHSDPFFHFQQTETLTVGVSSAEFGEIEAPTVIFN